MNNPATPGKAALVALVGAALTAAFSALAITKDEWEANPSLIPDPATGAFYAVEPSPLAGAQAVAAVTEGLDATPPGRTYDLPFETQLSTHAPGLICIIM